MLAIQGITEGTKVATIARDGARMGRVNRHITLPIWCGAIYVARRRQRDGVLTWRRVVSFGATYCGRGPSSAMVRRIREEAEARGLEFFEHIRHGAQVRN